jgi:hypothetical protein
MRRTIAALLLLGLNCVGQQNFPASFRGTFDVGQMIVPTSLATVSTKDSFAMAGEFYNSSGASITLTLSDSSTSCSGAACAKTFTIAAGQMWCPTFPNTRYTGGIKWKASATGLIGWMSWGN